MTRTLLLRGMLVGIVAGLLVFAFARLIGEPQIERAIAFETSLDQAKGNAPEPEMVSRKIQKSIGLLTGVVVYGAAIGGIFGLVFAFAYGRSGIASPRALSALLAGLGFVAIVVVPTLKYPANPPSVGNPDTIGVRTAAFFLLIAFSIAATVLAIQVGRHLKIRYGAWNASLLAALLFILIMIVVSHFFPAIDEVPSGFPATLMWRFRIAALEIQVVMWTTLGLLFGWLTERDGKRRSSVRAIQPKPQSRPESKSQPNSMTRRRFAAGMFFVAMAVQLPAQKRPQRIVSTAPSITEALFALGLGSQVVGVSRFCDFPPEVQKLPKVGTYIKPDAEAIARLTPDLVILQGNSGDLTDRLNALRISFVEVPHGTLNDVFTGIQIIAKAAGVPERAAGVIDPIKSSLEAIQTKAKALPSPRVLVIVDRRQGTLAGLTAIGPDNYVNQILEIAGGINVLAKPGLPQYPHISLETVLHENPDVILDLSGSQESEAERQAAREATLSLWRKNTELTAVRNGHVYAGTSNALVVPGPRTPQAAQRLFDFIHGIGGQS